MRYEGALPDLKHRALTQAREFRETATLSSGAPWREVDGRIALVTIGALNLWHQYCRQYFLSCALGTADRNGAAVANGVSTFPTEGAALTWATSKVSSTERYMGEPRWRDPAIWLKVMHELRTSMEPNVLLVAGLATDVFADLPAFRNFYAHRCRQTAKRAAEFRTRNIIVSRPHPTEILRASRASTTYSIIVDWLDEIYAAIDLTA
jgi:hypothetical protein